MGRIYLIKGISIYIYFRDHNPPHFHAFYAEYEGVIRIKDGLIIKGYLPAKELRVIGKWLADAKVKKQLIEMFHEMNPALRR